MPITVSQSIDRLDTAVGSGKLADLCERFGVEIVTLFGSAR